MTIQIQLNTLYKNHQELRVFWSPSRKLELSHIVNSLCRIFNGFQLCPLLGCYRTLAAGFEAIPAPIWLSEHKWLLIYVFWHSRASSPKICSFGSTHCSLHPYKSNSPFCWKAPPQHDATTTMLRGRSAIRRVMSCARFPPDRELCFMAESLVSISSEQTLLPLASLKCLFATSRRLPLPLHLEVAFFWLLYSTA